MTVASALWVFILAVVWVSPNWNTRTAFPADTDWNRLPLGMTESEVVKTLGKPFKEETFRYADGAISHTYLYYSEPIIPFKNYKIYKVLLSPDKRVIDTKFNW